MLKPDICNAFIDESYVIGGVYYLGAVLLSEAQVLAIESVLEQISGGLGIHGVEAGLEFHGADIFHATGEWQALKRKPDLRVAIYRRVLKALSDLEVTYMFEGINTLEHKARYGSKAHPTHQLALQYLLERIARNSATASKKIRVIADRVPDQHSHDAQMQRFQIQGTPGYRSSNLKNIVLPITWEDSKSHRSLQAVDMATYIIRRFREHPSTAGKASKEVEQLAEIVIKRTASVRVWPEKH